MNTEPNRNIVIRVVGDVNMNTITIPKTRTLQTSYTHKNVLTSSENDLLYSRYQELGGTQLLAKAIHHSTRAWKHNPPQVLTYDQKFLKDNSKSWREMLANLSLYRNKAGALDTTVYRINADIGWIENKGAQSTEKTAYLELLKLKMKRLVQPGDLQGGNQTKQSRDFTINVITIGD